VVAPIEIEVPPSSTLVDVEDAVLVEVDAPEVEVIVGWSVVTLPAAVTPADDEESIEADEVSIEAAVSSVAVTEVDAASSVPAEVTPTIASPATMVANVPRI
ncbi:MAG: hypothetical protein ACRDU9_03540, partial [Acidimicrobiia bacterium]